MLKKHFLIIVLLLNFVETVLNVLTEQHLIEIEIYPNIINVFTVTFDQFNVSLLNKSKGEKL